MSLEDGLVKGTDPIPVRRKTGGANVHLIVVERLSVIAVRTKLERALT
jgi:hypothetical protein